MKENISNTLSLLNLSLGFLSLFFIFQGEFFQASILVLVAVAVDCIDGTIARLLKIDSDLGKNLDNISDVVSFIVVPAIFSYFVLLKEMSFPFNYALFVLSLFFVIAGVYRTARINVTHTPGFFNGLPTTFNGLVFPGLYISNFFSIYIISGWMILSSVLMVSEFRIKRPFFKKKKKKEVVEIKDESEEDNKKDNENIVPLSIFGD